MRSLNKDPSGSRAKVLRVLMTMSVVLAALWSTSAEAIPLFNRQTGQNCVACHMGGQFPELTPYGRLFKMTGYTLGQRVAAPVSVMAVASMAKISNTTKLGDPASPYDFDKNSSLTFSTASLFLGGKVTDNIGAFVQITYDPYATQSADGAYHGHTGADNIDLRYADRFIDNSRDLIVGVSMNNNPSVSDPWNTVAAWMQYAPVPSPGSNLFIDGNTPFPSFGAGGNIAGVTAYAFWNQTVYAELGAYQSSKGLLSFMSAGLADADKTRLKGTNPYWRLALNHEWGAHSLMIGTAGMVANIYDDPLDTSDPSTVHQTRDWSVDAQYQYMLDPHTVTAQFVYAKQHARVSDAAMAALEAAPGAPNADDTNVTRGKLTYTYNARYGGSLAVFSLKGSQGNLSPDPATRGITYEAFVTPVQNVRIGAQYTTYSIFNGASENYDGFGRNAKDNNSLFLYVWAAY